MMNDECRMEKTISRNVLTSMGAESFLCSMHFLELN